MLTDYVRQVRALSRNARLYLIANAIQAVSAGALAVLYTLYLAALGYGTDFIGLVLVVGTIGGGLGIVPASPIVRRWGWRTTLIWSDVIGGSALFLQLIFPVRWVILVTTLGVGASVALLLVVNSPFLAANSDDRERTALFALNNALAFLAAVVGELLGGILPIWFAAPAVRHAPLVSLAVRLVPGAKAQAYELALLATGALALPSLLPVLWLREPPRPAVPSASARRPLAALAWPGAAQWHRVRTLAVGPVGRFAVTQALVGFGAGLFGPYVNLYFVNELGASVALYGVLASTLTALLAVGSLLIVPIASRLGKVRAAIVTELSSLPFLVALGLAPSLLIASVALLIRGPLMNAGGPALQAYLMESVPPDERVVASGVYNVSWQLMTAVGAGAGGFIIARAGYPSVFVGATVLYAISIALVALWFGRSSAPERARYTAQVRSTLRDGERKEA